MSQETNCCVYGSKQSIQQRNPKFILIASRAAKRNCLIHVYTQVYPSTALVSGKQFFFYSFRQLLKHYFPASAKTAIFATYEETLSFSTKKIRAYHDNDQEIKDLDDGCSKQL